MKQLPPIPTPFSQRWRQFRIRWVPVFIFLAVSGVVAWLWNLHVAPSTMRGQVELVEAQVVSPDAGVLTNLWVTRFQEVRAGDVIAEIAGIDSQSLDAAAQAIRSGAALAQLEMDPVFDQQRHAFDFQRLRLDLLRQKVSLATARVNLQRAATEFRRVEELFQAQLISEDEYELALRSKEALEVEVEETAQLLADMEAAMARLETFVNGTDDFSAASEQVAARGKEALQKFLSSSIVLRAPIDGVVSSIYRRTGENVVAGEPILAISSLQSERIISYLRQPIQLRPETGMLVEIRRLSTGREGSMGQVLAVGRHLELISSNLTTPGLEMEWGLPIAVSIPPDMDVLPGEIVNLTIRPASAAQE